MNVYTTTSLGYLIEGHYGSLKPDTPLEGAGIIISSVTAVSGIVNS
jgi:hypothetical protein